MLVNSSNFKCLSVLYWVYLRIFVRTGNNFRILEKSVLSLSEFFLRMLVNSRNVLGTSVCICWKSDHKGIVTWHSCLSCLLNLSDHHLNTLSFLTLYFEGILSLLRRLHALTEICIKDFYFGRIWSEILALEWLSCLPSNWPLILKLTN